MYKIGLFLHSEPYSGGTFQYNQAMIEAVSQMSKNKYKIIIVYTQVIWKEYLDKYDIEAIYVPRSIYSRAIHKLFHEFSMSLNICRRIGSKLDPFIRKIVGYECDLWIFPSQDMFSYILPVLALSTIHDLMHRYEPSFPEVSANSEYERREKHYSSMCKYAKGILVDSKIGKSHVMECYNKNEREIFPLPFIPPQYIYNYRDRNNGEIEGKHNLPPKYIFYPAQFWEHKNHQNLIKAINSLKDQLPDLKLVLVGSKKNGYKTVQELIHSLNLESYVYFLGYVPDIEIPFLYKNARAMVMPTFLGPTNIPPLEGFALGCPVAISNKYGMPEQVGDAALLFDPNNIEEIAAIIRRLWTDDDLCRRLVSRGFERNQAWGQKDFRKRLECIITTLLSREG
jgi:glycosyltransferase involved in cell wall biosynthesis